MKYRLSCAALAAVMLLSGCASTDVNQEDLNGQDLMVDLVSGGNYAVEPDAVTQETAEPSAESETSEAEPEFDEEMNSDLDVFYEATHEKFELSDEELSFLDYSLLVGDSICSGFSEYGIVPHERVAAKGNLGSRSFFDYTFRFRGWDGRSYDDVLRSANPRYVFLSMGMNDVNMVDEETYCENYRKVIEATLEGSRADVFVAAITPVCSKFCGNSVIDSFNDTMRAYIEENFPERVHYLDFGRYLKNERNELRECLHSGDGVHLGPYAYRIALWEMHRALTEAGLWDGDSATGTFEAENFQQAYEVPPVYTTTPAAETTAPAETTSPKTTKPAKTTKPSATKPAKTTRPSTTTAIPVEASTSENTSVQPTSDSGSAEQTEQSAEPVSGDDLAVTEQPEPVELPTSAASSETNE